jgi:hypothetical protein
MGMSGLEGKIWLVRIEKSAVNAIGNNTGGLAQFAIATLRSQ